MILNRFLGKGMKGNGISLHPTLPVSRCFYLFKRNIPKLRLLAKLTHKR